MPAAQICTPPIPFAWAELVDELGIAGARTRNGPAVAGPFTDSYPTKGENRPPPQRKVSDD